MDKTFLSAIVALKEEVAKSLTVLGEFPKKDPFDHGLQVGVYNGLKTALETLEAVAKDEVVRQDNL